MDIYYMSNGLTFELDLYNIFLRNFQDRCQMTRKYDLQNFMRIGWELTDWIPKSLL